MTRDEGAEHRWVIVMVLTISMAVSFYGCYSRKWDLDRVNRDSGEQIVRALRQYHREKSVYPSELAALEPAYLKEVPSARLSASATAQFSYSVIEDGKDFTLEYPEAAIGMFPSDAAYEYGSRAGQWKHKMY